MFSMKITMQTSDRPPSCRRVLTTSFFWQLLRPSAWRRDIDHCADLCLPSRYSRVLKQSRRRCRLVADHHSRRRFSCWHRPSLETTATRIFLNLNSDWTDLLAGYHPCPHFDEHNRCNSWGFNSNFCWKLPSKASSISNASLIGPPPWRHTPRFG